jgi:hypothetical protein
MSRLIKPGCNARLFGCVSFKNLLQKLSFDCKLKFSAANGSSAFSVIRLLRFQASSPFSHENFNFRSEINFEADSGRMDYKMV